jgi:lysozyme family protein
MTGRFKAFLPFIFEHECVFAKGHWGDYNFVIAEEVKGDRGGVTKWGCDISEFSEKPFYLTADDIRNLTMEQATDLYWRNWDRFHVESMKYPLGEVWFNCKIVSGRGQANKILERTRNDPAAFIKDQKRVNQLIVDAHPSDKQFLKGWNNRLEELAKFLHIQNA